MRKAMSTTMRTNGNSSVGQTFHINCVANLMECQDQGLGRCSSHAYLLMSRHGRLRSHLFSMRHGGPTLPSA